VKGLEDFSALVAGFDVRAALKLCELDYETVREVCRLFATRKSCLHDDLGILMNRHSTLVSYLIVVFLAICGRIGVPGGNYFPGRMMGGRTHTDPSDPDTWRTVVTNIPAIQGQFPPNVMPEEIMNNHSDRLRAVLIYGSNPLRSYADTTAYEKAFGRLDLLVTTEMVMSETAVMSHYVLPSRSAYEGYDGTFFSFHFPEVYFQMRQPVVEPEGEQLEAGEIFTRLADKMGLIPELPESLYSAANSGCSRQYRDALMGYVMGNPNAQGAIPFIVAKTLGKALGSAHLAGLCAMLLARTKTLMEDADRAGFALGPDQGLEMFKTIIEHPEGVLVGLCDPEQNINELDTPDKKIHLFDPTFAEWLNEINPADEEKRSEERRVGKECRRLCRSRWSPYH
jgi:hypothetical protein